MSLTALRAREAANRIALEHLHTNPAITEALPALAELTGQTIEALEKALAAHHSKAQAIKASDRLTDRAKAEDLAALKDQTRRAIVQILNQGGLEANLQRIEAEATNQLARTRKQYTTGKDPAEALVSRMDQAEARAEARRVRAEAKEEHNARLEAAKAAGVVLSDDEKTFQDPVAAQFLAACKTYSPEKEAFISALEAPPFGVSVLPQEVIDQGRQAIKQVVCRDLLAAQASAQVRLAQAKELARIAEQAMHHLPGQQEDRPLMTDQDRQRATA